MNVFSLTLIQKFNTSQKLGLSALLTIGVLTSCGGTPSIKPDTTNTSKLEDLHVVDCLLPGQLRRLGGTQYLTPRRPVKTSAADCRIRGGEYVAYDRADYKTALNIWLPAAEAGDQEAQANVGEIFERGLGGEPNYALAVFWYEKSAKQGNSRAQFNLGTLYEQGLGVEKNKLTAMNYYRQAWGMQEDDVIFQSAAREEQEALRQRLSAKAKKKEGQITLLNRQIAQLKKDAERTKNEQSEQDELQQLVALVSDLETQRLSDLDEMNALPRLREPSAKATLNTSSKREAQTIQVADINFGKYYALVIGNQNYDQIGNLKTPHADALRAKSILENKYNFNVTVVLDADSATIMRKVNDFSSKLGENDNLLIFYAGHGSRIRAENYEAGYWLPVDADPPPEDTFWVSNEFVTRHLSRLKAKRVLIVSDSCYAGLLSNAPGFLFTKNQAPMSKEYVKYKLPKKSRLLISSGGDRPVLDNADGGNSVFAKAFLDALESAQGIVTGPELFLKIRKTVEERAGLASFEQKPELKVIKGAGHEVGDFFFVNKI